MTVPEAEQVSFKGDTGSVPLFLFMPFYTPKDRARSAELLACLDENLGCKALAGICLIIDDDTELTQTDPRLRIVRQKTRPSYLDWYRLSQRYAAGGISILANSDIVLGQDVTELRKIFATDQNGFVALSRHDRIKGGLEPHSNPHWSQDLWAFMPKGMSDPVMEARLNVPLGVPRCDNKIAYVFPAKTYSQNVCR